MSAVLDYYLPFNAPEAVERRFTKDIYRCVADHSAPGTPCDFLKLGRANMVTDIYVSIAGDDRGQKYLRATLFLEL